MKKPILKFLGILLLFIISAFYMKSRINRDNEYLKEINLSLSGNVTDIFELKQGHDFGIITLDVIKSSRKYYDERSNRKTYFGIIKDSKAKIAVNFISSIELNDEIIINGINYKIKRNNKIVDEGIWGLPFDLINNPYNEIRDKIKD